MKIASFPRRMLFSLLALSSLSSTWLDSPANAADFPDGSIPGAVGIQLKNSNMSATYLDLVEGVGAGFVRKAVYWSSIEPTAGTYNWSQPDSWIAMMEARGLPMLITVVWNNRAYENLHDRAIVTAAGHTAYGNFCQALAARYAGKNIVWEIWNEPNTSSFWDSGSTVLNKAVEYTALVKVAAPKFKQGDPTSKVVGASLATIWYSDWWGGAGSGSLDWLQKCVEEGLLTSGIDGISIHPYESGKPEDLHTGRYTILRNILRNGGAPDMPILGSEVGFSEGTFTSRGFTAAEARELQACYFVRQQMVDRMNGILATNWYDLKEEASFSMLKSDNTPQPVWYACETLIAELSGYSFKDEIILPDSTDYAVLFENTAGAQKIVAWTTQDTAPHAATIRVGSSGAKTIVDIDGDTSTLTANASGDLTLTLSRSPQYIRLTSPLPGKVKTIVDNTDGSPATAIQGTWTAYNGTVLPTELGFYGTNYVLDGNTGTGKFVSLIPSLPFAAQYDIYIRWNAASARASNAKYIVSSNEGTQTYLVDQKTNGGRWRYLATRSFSAGRNTSRYVRISNDAANGSVCADAVMFVTTAPTGATMRDGSGNIYLGNDHVPYDASQDGSGSGPSSIVISADKRSATLTGNTWKAFPLSYTVTADTVLEVTVNGTNLAEVSGIALDNNINPVSGKRAFLFGGSGGAQAWGWSISPPYTAGSGSVTFVIQVGAFFTGSVTHLGFIGDDDAAPFTTNVTYSDIRLYEATAQEVILDNNGPGVAYVGAWTTSTSGAGYFGTNYQHDNNAASELKTATYSPTFVAGGSYELYIQYSAAANRATNAQVLVNHQGGQSIVTVNQRVNGGQWNYLGIYTFPQSGGSVVLKNKLPNGTALDGYTIADGFKFTPAP